MNRTTNNSKDVKPINIIAVPFYFMLLEFFVITVIQKIKIIK